MIVYFTGTGNSLHAAKVIAAAQSDQIISIPKEFDKPGNTFTYALKDKELLGFVYPVYAWGPPKMVLDFIGRMSVTGGKPFVFSLNTCGSEEGNTTVLIQKALAKKGIVLNNAFSIAMPSNYIVGYDVYSKAKEFDILQNAEKKLAWINTVLTKRETGIFRLLPGTLPKLKTAIVSPLFNQFATNTKNFYVTDACTQCGLCERICPIHSIRVKYKPVWLHECTQCLACINRCPAKAIQYGKATVKRGRYVHPDL